MTFRHHLVTMTNGKSLAKMNQRTIFALIAFLVWIVSFHSTSCNSFVLGIQSTQRSPKTPSKTILFLNNSPAITTSSLLQHNIYWTTGKLQLPLHFEWSHRNINLASGFWQHFVPPPNHEYFKYNFSPCNECATDLKLFVCSRWHDGSHWCNPKKSFPVSRQR